MMTETLHARAVADSARSLPPRRRLAVADTFHARAVGIVVAMVAMVTTAIAATSAPATLQSATLPTPAISESPRDPRDLYGDGATYLVTRNGAPAGVHRLRFAGDNAALTVTAETRATMKIFGIFTIPFVYDSRAVWSRGELLTLSASFSGENYASHWLRRDGDAYFTQQGERTTGEIFPTNHWNSAALAQRRLYNTLSGNLIDVAFTRRDDENITIGDRAIRAARYDSRGDLNISLWYSAEGQWLQLQFRALGSDYRFTYQPAPQL